MLNWNILNRNLKLLQFYFQSRRTEGRDCYVESGKESSGGGTYRVEEEFRFFENITISGTYKNVFL